MVKKYLLSCLLLLFLAACSNTTDTPLPTLAPTASVNQSGGDSTLPATNTPGIPLDGSDLGAIDAVLQEIDNDVCHAAHETRAEIAEMMAQGEDVADLETAVIELIAELDNCSLDITPAP